MNELEVIKNNLPAQKEDLDGLTGGEYLPRLQLMTSQSTKCKSGEFPINHYALVDGTEKDLGREVDVVPLCFRATAMDFNDGLVVTHDKHSQLFADIKARAGRPNSGCQFGPEFLVYIPSVNKLATLFCGSKTAQKEAASIAELMSELCTLSSRERKNAANQTWFGLTCKKSAAVLTNAPDAEELQVTIEEFLNDKGTIAEESADTASGREA